MGRVGRHLPGFHCCPSLNDLLFPMMMGVDQISNGIISDAAYPFHKMDDNRPTGRHHGIDNLTAIVGKDEV